MCKIECNVTNRLQTVDSQPRQIHGGGGGDPGGAGVGGSGGGALGGGAGASRLRGGSYEFSSLVVQNLRFTSISLTGTSVFLGVGISKRHSWL